MRIALVTPNAVGGVATTQNKLYRGLVGEGFHVDLIKLRALPYAVVDDFLNGKRLAEYDLLLCTGKISEANTPSQTPQEMRPKATESQKGRRGGPQADILSGRPAAL
jgi:hypothetical protein